ncbi:uncharacterized protein DS421_12g361370 [Arachis hypogaea]|nr:uncharacterized protein DS421_12g361370 [Arachis hypogaea]
MCLHRRHPPLFRHARIFSVASPPLIPRQPWSRPAVVVPVARSGEWLASLSRAGTQPGGPVLPTLP